MRHRLRFAEANSRAVMPGNGNQSNALALSKQNLIKKSMLLLVALLIFTSVVLKAQSPQKINFQSIVRNTSGVIVSNKSVKFKITILADSATGEPVYSETHLKTTDAIGLVSLQIGSGTVVSNGVFSSLNWGNASHFIKLEADFTGGNNYVTLGTQELMSVPYAMYAAKTDTASLNLTNRFAEKAPVNNPSFTGTVGGITKAMVGLSDVDNTSDANKQVSTATQAALDTKFNKADFPRGSNRGEFLYWNGENWQSLESGEPGQSIIIDQNRNPTWGCIVTNTAGTPSTNPSLVVNTALTDITIATTGATGIAQITEGLPNGVTATWSDDVITISGTPTDTGSFTYIIPLTGGCGNVKATGTITVTPAPSACPTATITYNSYTYKTVGIGNQCWMAENLRTRKYNDGTEIRFDNSGGSGGSTSQTWAGTGLNYGAYTIYANDSTATTGNLAIYGYLYNWYAVAGIITDGGTPATKNICPIGWHVPTDAEWTILTDTLGGGNVAGRKMKSTGTTYWSTESTGTNNSSGFSALPGGYRFAGGSFGRIRGYAFFWSATENASDYAWNLFLYDNFATVRRSSDFNKPVGGSVRCLKNSSCTANTAAAPSTTPSLVVNTALTDITIATTGATGIAQITEGLPNGVTATWSDDVITISGIPTASGTFEYKILLTGGCGDPVYATGTITVTTATVSACPTTTITYNGDDYKTVGIGNQCWMAENLRTRKYNDGTDIRFDNSGGTGGSTSQTWVGNGINYGAYTIYANDSTANPSNLTSYGYLYNWYAAKGIITDGGQSIKNICPLNWHVPAYSDWNKLVKSIDSGADTTGAIQQSTTAGLKMKSTGTTYWNFESTGTNNSSGFSALPGGYRDSGNDGSFSDVRFNAYFWSATEESFYNAFSLSLNFNTGIVYRLRNEKLSGISIRCLKD